ncbi:MAG TPA: indole-3-glycerol phosphate synthase TrpC [Blastocatellia bacterium]|nr:indole-3-glycerol phosphate synthase TrpC [Blastocatellia bacterium]
MTTSSTTLPQGCRQASGILDRIVQAKAKRLEEAKKQTPMEILMSRAGSLQSRPGASLSSALRQTERINVIAELKRRSPSKGVICNAFDSVRIAECYASSGAAALSVLTEKDFFEGSLADLSAVRDRVPLPLLRKDFIFDHYQLYEAVMAGANAVLLIVAILEDELLSRLIEFAASLGLDALVEVHSAEEMKRAAQAGASLIGVNNRDLTTFYVDLRTSIELASLAPPRALLVSESGITTGKDIRRLSSAGFNAFLVGEHLMRADDPGEALAQLIAEANA